MQNQVILNGLETCLRYEVLVTALCNGLATEPSESFFFDTECIPLSAVGFDLAEEVIIYPNPFKDQINIQLRKPFDIKVVQLYTVSGLEVKITNIDTQLGQIQLNTIGELEPGLYILKLEGEFGSMIFKVVKT
jgi:hypothetical protein